MKCWALGDRSVVNQIFLRLTCSPLASDWISDPVFSSRSGMQKPANQDPCLICLSGKPEAVIHAHCCAGGHLDDGLTSQMPWRVEVDFSRVKISTTS